MDLKKEITEIIYKNSHDTSEGVLIDFKVIIPLIENIVAISVTHCSDELNDKKIKDLVNWVKSDLAEESSEKVGKWSTPYREEKIRFLNKLLEIGKL